MTAPAPAQLPPLPVPARPAGTKRISGIDVARAVAILGMLIAHLGTGHHPDGGGWGEQWMWYFDGRSSALFATLAGVSIALMSRRADTALGWRAVRVKITVRAVLILLIGLFLQALETPVAIILPTYAVLFLMALPVLRLPTRWLLALAGVAVVVGPVVVLGLRQATTQSVRPTELNFGFGIAELVWGYYPALIWIAYLLVGMAMGRGALASPRYAAGLLGGGAAIAAIGYGGGLAARNAWASGLYPPDELFWPDVLVSVEPHSSSTFEVVGNIGVALAVTGLCLLLASGRAGAAALWPLASTGAMALTIYTAQIVVIWLLGPASVWYPTSNVPLVSLAVGSVAFACLWRALFGQGPLERILKLASDTAARLAVGAAVAPR